MRIILISLLCVSSLLACKKRKPEVAPAPAPAAETTAADAKEPTLEELNLSVQAWFTSRGRAPESLEEMAKARFLSKVPTPPAGRQYVIDKEKLRVVLQ